MTTDPDSPLVKHTPKDAEIDTLIDLRVDFQTSHHDLKIEPLPRRYCRPKDAMGWLTMKRSFVRISKTALTF
ncbi:hypothetical protein [Shimia sp. NS0008-38b]|uniref:hypothetical protein n=1 Tax=Shimia sp. NS0008-38b TaxID=3127653 RepID=UPI0033416944